MSNVNANAASGDPAATIQGSRPTGKVVGGGRSIVVQRITEEGDLRVSEAGEQRILG